MQIEYWINYAGTGDAYRKKNDLDCILTNLYSGVYIVGSDPIKKVREPYRLLVLAGGKFKETNFGAFAEAIINLVVSLLFIIKFGLIGVAVGTLVAIAFRLIYLVWYLHKDIIQLSYASLSPYMVTFIVAFAMNLFVYISWPLMLNGIVQFFVAGCIVFVAECGVCGLAYWINRRIFQA